MKNTQKGSTTIIIVIIIIVIILAGIIYQYTRKNGQIERNSSATINNIPQVSVEPSNKIPATSPTKGSITVKLGCGLSVVSTAPNTKVSFPLLLTGIIDNTKASDPNCTWGMFEGQAGTAQLFYNYQNSGWKPLGDAVTVKVPSWTSNVTSFSVTLNFKNDSIGLPSGTPLKVVFIPENPSGIPNSKSFTLPIVLK